MPGKAINNTGWGTIQEAANIYYMSLGVFIFQCWSKYLFPQVPQAAEPVWRRNAAYSRSHTIQIRMRLQTCLHWTAAFKNTLITTHIPEHNVLFIHLVPHTKLVVCVWPGTQRSIVRKHCKQLVKVQLRYQDRGSAVTCVSGDDFSVSRFRVGKANTIPEGLK